MQTVAPLGEGKSARESQLWRGTNVPVMKTACGRAVDRREARMEFPTPERGQGRKRKSGKLGWRGGHEERPKRREI